MTDQPSQAAISKDDLLRLLCIFRTAPLRWHEEDLCFLFVDVLRYVLMFCEPEGKARFFYAMRPHNEQCGGCWKNIRATADRSEDPVKREAYGSLYVASLQEYAKWKGNDVRVNLVPGGANIRIRFTEESDPLCEGLEGYASRDPKGESWNTLDVRTEAIFRDPRVILQRFDRSATQDVKECNQRPEWASIQWQMLFRNAGQAFASVGRAG